MILLFTELITPRVQYICSFIFKELMQADFALTTDAKRFGQYNGVAINYSGLPFSNNAFQIKNTSLLFETGIRQQSITFVETKEYKAFFTITDSDFPFDIFAASFYLLSRYEEYLPHQKDMYGRYAHENSVAFKEGFLRLPLINIWVKYFAHALQKKCPSFNINQQSFRFLPTYDIDIAYAYQHKSLLKTIGGFIKSPSVNRIKVLMGIAKDPFDVYNWLDNFHQQYGLQPIYFFLLAEKNGRYDKNILPDTTAVKKLVAEHAKKYAVGIHPGWQSGEDDLLLRKEKKTGENLAGQIITKSRQHYIRFNLPEGYRRLIEAGITDDYSMGYGSINGFRASVATSFYWYDLVAEEATLLRIHPFCFMDANSFYEQRLSAEAAFDELVQYLKICREVNGTFCSIWHNNFLGTDKQFAGWRQCYEKFILLLQ